jgi:ICEA Protein
MRKTKNDLFLELAKPNKLGVSSWINVSDFVNVYKDLAFGNGASWARKESTLAKIYVIEFDKSITSGNGIDRIRLNGFNQIDRGTQNIRKNIKDEIIKQRCIVLGTSHSTNKPIEVDHKNGRKDDLRVMNTKTQEITDFQPLSKAANDAKRQACKKCVQTGLRFDAKILGYNYSVIEGGVKYTEKLKCKGCFWYDPIVFRKKLIK